MKPNHNDQKLYRNKYKKGRLLQYQSKHKRCKDTNINQVNMV
jgi:hypothetical protein